MIIKMHEFIEKACEGSGVQNDDRNVWVTVDGIVCTVDIKEVIDHSENVPFEASDFLENNADHFAWVTLYEQFCEKNRERSMRRYFLQGDEYNAIGFVFDDGMLVFDCETLEEAKAWDYSAIDGCESAQEAKTCIGSDKIEIYPFIEDEWEEVTELE